MAPRQKILAAALLNLLLSTASYGREQPKADIVEAEQSLGLIQVVELAMEDQVEGGCWTNVERVKQRARLALEQSGIKVYTEPLFHVAPFTTRLSVSALGKRGGGVCFGDVVVRASGRSFLRWGENEEFAIETMSVNFSKRAIFVNPRSLDGQILEAVDTFVSEFAADVIANRRHGTVAKLLKEYPHSGDDPITMKQFWEDVKTTFEASKKAEAQNK